MSAGGRSGHGLFRGCRKLCFLVAILTLTASLCISYGGGTRASQQLSPRARGPSGQVQQVHLSEDESSQRQMKDEEYEQLSQKQEGEGAERLSDSENERVVPSPESHGNSQVVFVNLARVVKDRNDTERVISSRPQPIKQEGQIACGETNRLGKPSSEPSSETLQNRIVGGNKADPGEFPYQVRLNIRSRRGSSLCGGVIIDKRHILTAAHCMTTW